MRTGLRASLAVFAVALGMVVSSASAAVFTLEDQNSSAIFDMAGDGQIVWVVDGVDQLFEQSFWWRVGSAGAEAPVTGLDVIGSLASDSNPWSDSRVDVLGTLYRDPAQRFEIELSYKLRGGLPGTKTSDLAETIVIRNLSATSLAFNFFQYVDFDLGGLADDDTVWFSNDNTVVQTSEDMMVTETVVTPVAANRQVDYIPVLIDLLTDSDPSTLSNNNGPLGPGNVAWAFQWTFDLAPGGTFIISKDKLIVPEPTTMALLGCGLFAGLLRRRR